jgi:hypothetical protein
MKEKITNPKNASEGSFPGSKSGEETNEGTNIETTAVKTTPIAEKKNKEITPEMRKNLRAAEILLGRDDLRNLSAEEILKQYPKIEEILKDEKLGFSGRAINQASKVVELRDKMLAVYKDAIEEQKRTGESLSDIMTRRQRETKRGADFLMLENIYAPALKELKRIILEDKNALFEKEFGKGDPRVLEKMMAQEVNLVTMMSNERKRVDDIKSELLAAESIKNEGCFKKSLRWYAKLPLPVRSVLGAAAIGTATAALLPGTVAAAGGATLYLGYRAARSLAGGSIAAGLQKLFGNKIVKRAYEKDIEKVYKESEEEIMGRLEKRSKIELGLVELVKEKLAERKEKKALGETEEDLQALNKRIEELILAKKFDELAELNYELAGKINERIEKLGGLRRKTTMAMMTATGLAGGAAGARLVDWLVGPNFSDITSRGGEERGRIEIAEPQKVVSSEDLKLATVGKGEGVTHALVRQLKANPAEFGYDSKSGMDLDKWATLKARSLAIDAGYIKADGSEVRVFDIGPAGPEDNPAYVLKINASGKPVIYEYLGGKPAGTSGTIDSYEYKWIPTEKGSGGIKTSETITEIPEKELHPLKPSLSEMPSPEIKKVPLNLENIYDRYEYFSQEAQNLPKADQLVDAPLVDYETALSSYDKTIANFKELKVSAGKDLVLESKASAIAESLGKEASLLEKSPAFIAARENLEKFIQSLKIEKYLWNGLKQLRLDDLQNIARNPEKISSILNNYNINAADKAAIINGLAEPGAKKTVGELFNRLAKALGDEIYSSRVRTGNIDRIVKQFIFKDRVDL